MSTDHFDSRLLAKTLFLARSLDYITRVIPLYTMSILGIILCVNLRWSSWIIIPHERTNHVLGTEDPRYNDTVYYQRLCCQIEFAVIKKLDRTT